MSGTQARRLVLSALVVVALGVPSSALGAGGVAGTYATTVKTPVELKGKWVLTLAKSGAYTVALNREPLARGRYTATAKTITFGRESGGGGCAGAGTYAWTSSGKTTTFVRKRESASCGARAAVLAHRFTRVR